MQELGVLSFYPSLLRMFLPAGILYFYPYFTFLQPKMGVSLLVAEFSGNREDQGSPEARLIPVMTCHARRRNRPGGNCINIPHSIESISPIDAHQT
jgi:hypothetical protein